MNSQYDLKRYSILYVDDEEMALKYFEKTFGREFRILTATNAADGMKLIEQHGEDIGVLISDQRMPGEKGVQLLERARQLRPRLVRMLITAYADFGVTVDAVNLGNIFRYVSKPLQVEDMSNTLRRAMEFYMIQQERDELLREKLSVLQNMLITDRVISLGVLAAGLNQRLRNPLQAVHAFLELTPGKLSQGNVDLSRLRDPVFWREFHDLVVRQASRIADLLGDIAEDSYSGSDEGLDAKSIINSTIERLRPSFTGKSIDLRSDVSDPLPHLRGEPRKFQKIFELLLQCELASLAPNAVVTLSAKAAKVAGELGGLIVTLTDDGAGLPVNALRSVFDPFFISVDDQQEFGLNLMGVYFLVYHHGGKITTINTPGSSGLSLFISIPLAPLDLATAAGSSREFVTSVLLNDSLWERLLPQL